MKLILENLDKIIDAPNGIEKARELVLQLAVQGKLTEEWRKQNPDVEPASKLLKKIKAEKERLIKEGKIKKQKELPPINDDDLPAGKAGKPFELPDGWEWARINNIFNFIDYRGKTPKKIQEGVKLITAKNVRQGFLNIQPEEFISEVEYREWMTRGFPKKGDLLFTTEAPLGNVAQINIPTNFALAQRIIDLQPYIEMDTKFFLYAFMSKGIQSLIWKQATGMTAKGIKAAKLKLVLIIVPTLPEQQAIVEKVNSLMALLDELEQKRNKKNDKRVKANTAVLDCLVKSKDNREFKQNWKRIEDNFTSLYSVKENVDKLRQTILQLAVMGKLTEEWRKQNPVLPAPQTGYFWVYVIKCSNDSNYIGYTSDLIRRWNQHQDGEGADWTKKYKPQYVMYWEKFNNREDALKREKELKTGYGRKWIKREEEAGRLWRAGEPASELLKKIKAEKDRLIKEGKIKKQKELPPIKDDDLPAGKAGKPFELPDGWEWVRLGDATNYGISEKTDGKGLDENVWVLDLEDIEKISSKLLRKTRYKEKQFGSSKSLFLKNDVIYGKLRPYLDKVIVADEDGVCTTEMIPIRGFYKVDSYFLRWILKSQYFIDYANSSTHGMNLPRLGTDKARIALIPLTSFEEQQAIVEKVNELMTLCDQLEEKLNKKEAKAEKFVKAVVGKNK